MDCLLLVEDLDRPRPLVRVLTSLDGHTAHGEHTLEQAKVQDTPIYTYINIIVTHFNFIATETLTHSQDDKR